MAGGPSEIVDIVAGVSDIGHYSFLGVSGAVTMTGFFVDGKGDRVRDVNGALAAPFSGTIPVQSAGVTDAVTFATIAGLTGTLKANYPEVQGWIGTLNGAVYFDIQDAGTASAALKATPTKFPQLASSTNQTLSRVA